MYRESLDSEGDIVPLIPGKWSKCGQRKSLETWTELKEFFPAQFLFLLSLMYL